MNAALLDGLTRMALASMMRRTKREQGSGTLE
jgi:hypothetical protein